MAMSHDKHKDDTDERTIFVSNLSPKLTEEILFELFFQAGPVERVVIPKDKKGNNKTFGFVTYKHLKSVNYSLNIFAGTRLFNRELQMRSHRKNYQIPVLGNQRHNQQHQLQQPSTSRGDNNFVPGIDTFNQQRLMAIAAAHTAMTNLAAETVNKPLNIHGSSIPFGNYGGVYSSGPEPFREHYGDRNRNHRGKRRDSRSRPYRRSPSRSPQQSHRRRERAPSRLSDGGRRQGERSSYQRRDTR